MIRRFQAVEFIRPMERGINLPMLNRGVSGDDDAEIILKSRAELGDRPEAAVIEVFTTALARMLGLHAPEPVVVEISEEFVNASKAPPDRQQLLAASIGPKLRHGVAWGRSQAVDRGSPGSQHPGY